MEIIFDYINFSVFSMDSLAVRYVYAQ